MPFGFGGIGNEEFMRMCENHFQCENCDMKNGKTVTIKANNGQMDVAMRCETGINTTSTRQ